MAKKRNINLKQEEKEKTENYYELKVDAVNSLAEAFEEDSNKELTKEELEEVKASGQNPYSVDKLSKIPAWIKVFFIKFWIGGALCFFFQIGLGMYIPDQIDMMVFSGLALGALTDLVINTAFLHFESDRKEYHKYLLLPVDGRKFWTLLINVPYGVVEVLSIYGIYFVLQQYIFHTKIALEPLLFGVLYLLVDMLFISIKNLIVMLVRKYKK